MLTGACVVVSFFTDITTVCRSVIRREIGGPTLNF